MRHLLVLSVFTLIAACGQSEAPPPPAPATAAELTAAQPWFICDGINQPTLLFFSKPAAGGPTHVIEYEKPSGASVFTGDITLGPQDAGAGSIYTALIYNGEDAGAVREINPGMLENPGSAYTRPVVSVMFRRTEVECRWLPRTRLMGFTGRRTVVVHEDADGDLIYSSYNFTDAASSPPIELSDNGRSTRFSTEVRDGNERVGPRGAEFTFNTADGYAYLVYANADGSGRIDVTRNGAPVQSEPLTAFVVGDAATD